MHISGPSVTIIAPCYNEQQTVIRFLQSLEQELMALPYAFTVFIVNDCSTDDTLELLDQFRFASPDIMLQVISLETNIGHQGAIYAGLQFAGSLPCDHFIIMDADGEDAPSVISQLLALRHHDIIHVVRGQRHESLLFKSCYLIYKALFRIVTGSPMNFGNFCLVSSSISARAVASGFTHFPAFLSMQDCSRAYVVAGKQPRLGGSSKMGFRKHVQHAARSFAEYGMYIVSRNRPKMRLRSLYR